MTQDSARRTLTILLRLAGGMLVLAFPTMLLPVEWMASTHAWLGLGEFPRTAIVDYLARSVAAFNGFHGLLLLILATDPRRHIRIVQFVAFMNVTFGLMMVAVDLHAGLPLMWTLLEGPPIVVFGIVIAILTRRL
jgi:hypothetical protein